MFDTAPRHLHIRAVAVLTWGVLGGIRSAAAPSLMTPGQARWHARNVVAWAT